MKSELNFALPPMMGWMPILYQMIDSGDLAKMHHSAAALYLAIKRHADPYTGESTASNQQLMRETGLSKPTFYLARKSLIDFGYILFRRKTYPTVYIIIERIYHRSPDMEPIAVSSFPFRSKQLSAVSRGLSELVLGPEMLGSTVLVGSVNVQINLLQGDVDKANVIAPDGKGTTLEGKNPALPGKNFTSYNR